jgi:hypothetical protein
MFLEKSSKYAQATLPFDVSLQVSIEVLNSCLIILNRSVHNDEHSEALTLILQTASITHITSTLLVRFHSDSDVICYECADLRVESAFVCKTSGFLNI